MKRMAWLILIFVVVQPAAATPKAEQALEELTWLLQERQEQTYEAPDGQELGYFLHKSATPTNTAVVYLHGIASHAGWFSLSAVRLAEKGMDVYSLDRRGSGVNRNNRGIAAGHTDDYAIFIEDLHKFVTRIRGEYESVLLVGLSWGGKLATAYALQYGKSIDGLVLVTPGLVARADYSPLTKISIAACHFWCPENHYELPITPEMFSADVTWVNYIRSDELRNETVSAEFLWQTRELDKFIERDIHKLSVPTLLLLAGMDRIVDNGGVAALLLEGRQPMEIKVYPAQIHAIQLEIPETLSLEVKRWLNDGDQIQ